MNAVDGQLENIIPIDDERIKILSDKINIRKLNPVRHLEVYQAYSDNTTPIQDTSKSRAVAACTVKISIFERR